MVPRWTGDGNFLPIIARTKNMSQTLGETRQTPADVWDRAAQDHGVRQAANARAAAEHPRPGAGDPA